MYNGQLFENGNAQNLEYRIQTALDFQRSLYDCHQHIHRDSDPYLGLHGILRGAIEGLDPEMLLDPLEEELDLPAATVQLGNGRRRQTEVVGQKHHAPVVFFVEETYSTKFFRVVLPGIEVSGCDNLVALDA